MIWFALLILALLAYFLFKGLHARHIARSQTDAHIADHVPGSLQHTDNTQADALDNNNGSTHPNQPMPAPHDSPSLLYAERNKSAQQDSSSTGANDANSVSSGQEFPPESMDFTAETATLTSEEVGMPANSSEYEPSSAPNNNSISGASIATGVAAAAVAGIAANVSSGSDVTDTGTGTDTDFPSLDTDIPDIAVAETADAYSDINEAAIADTNIAHVNMAENRSTETVAVDHSIADTTTRQTGNHEHHVAAAPDLTQPDSTGAHSYTQGIDLELGDSTYNETDDLEIDDHDELLDFGDLTADISEMLKELNLRETDSPRLEIDQEEFQQLKTGEPGEVKPEKIENVAGKLRNMLQ